VTLFESELLERSPALDTRLADEVAPVDVQRIEVHDEGAAGQRAGQQFDSV